MICPQASREQQLCNRKQINFPWRAMVARIDSFGRSTGCISSTTGKPLWSIYLGTSMETCFRNDFYVCMCVCLLAVSFSADHFALTQPIRRKSALCLHSKTLKGYATAFRPWMYMGCARFFPLFSFCSGCNNYAIASPFSCFACTTNEPFSLL